jgi:hypothetical protein
MFGEQQPARLREFHRRNAVFVFDDAAQLARAQRKLGGQVFHVGVAQESFFDACDGKPGDAPHRVHGRRTRCEFGAAAQAGPISCGLGTGGVRIEGAPVATRRADGADGPAVNAGRGNGHEEHAVETRVARLDRFVAVVLIELHGGRVAARSEPVSPFSDTIAVAPRNVCVGGAASYNRSKVQSHSPIT